MKEIVAEDSNSRRRKTVGDIYEIEKRKSITLKYRVLWNNLDRLTKKKKKMQICDILNETVGIAKDPTDINGYHFFLWVTESYSPKKNF